VERHSIPSQEALRAVCESLPYGSRIQVFPTIRPKIFVEIFAEPDGLPKAWAEFLYKQSDLWGWGDVIVFAPLPSPFQGEAVPTQPCRWERKMLEEMLYHRLRQSDSEVIVDILAEQLDLSLSYKGPREFIEVLLSRAQTEGCALSPKAIIAWGNRKMKEKGLC
jgi:hypothetical protein